MVFFTIEGFENYSVEIFESSIPSDLYGSRDYRVLFGKVASYRTNYEENIEGIEAPIRYHSLSVSLHVPQLPGLRGLVW